MRRSLVLLLLALAACQSGHLSPDERDREFETLWNDIFTCKDGHSNSWDTDTLRTQIRRLILLACHAPWLYDRLVERVGSEEQNFRRLLSFQEEPPERVCGLGESYSQRLVDKALSEADQHRRRPYLRALADHAFHAHAQEARSGSYAESVPGRIARETSWSSEWERNCVVGIECGYYGVFTEVNEGLWRRLRNPGELESIRGAILQQLLHVGMSATTSTRDEILTGLCALLLDARDLSDPGAAGSLARHKLEHVRHKLTTGETTLFESTLEQVAREARALSYRFDAVQGLSCLKSSRAAPMVNEILGKEPTQEMLEKALYSVSGDTLYEVAATSPHERFRAGCLYGYSYTLFWREAGECEVALRRLLSRLREDSSEEVRATAVEALIRNIESAVRRGQISFAKALALAAEGLDTAVRDPSVQVRRTAVDQLREYGQFAAFLDPEIRTKLQELAASVPERP